MRRFAFGIALAAGLLAGTSASAAIVNFSLVAGSFDFSTAAVFIDGAGEFRTDGDEGVFSLGSGLRNFSLSGTEDVFEFGGDFRSLDGRYRLSLADLSSFSASLSGGEVTALSFATGPTSFALRNGGRPIGESETLSFNVAGTPANGFLTAVNSSRYGPQDGEAFIDQVAPGGVPEPATWAMMIGGFGLVGGVMRRRNRQVTTTVRYA